MKISCPHCKKHILISIDKQASIELDKSNDKDFVDPNDIIITKVSKINGIRKTRILDITDKSKSAVNSRHIAMYIMRTARSLPYAEIGKYFKVEHTTVMNAVLKIETAILNEEKSKDKDGYYCKLIEQYMEYR